MDIDTLLTSPMLKESERLQVEAGIEDPLAPARYLLNLIKKSGGIPNISRLVDIYNIVSASTGISMGLHDLEKIDGDLQLKVTDGTEKYTPIFEIESQPVNPGAFATVDENDDVLCYLDIKQGDKTKTTSETKDYLLYAQGNKETTEEDLVKALQAVGELIEKFCGGVFEIIERE